MFSMLTEWPSGRKKTNIAVFLLVTGQFLHSDQLRAVVFEISWLVRFEMPLKGREETLSVEGGLTFGKESQTLRERIEFDHCFRLYANETKSLSHLSAYSVILKHFTLAYCTLRNETIAKRNRCETKPLRNETIVKPLRNETIAKRDFKRSSTLMIVIIFY